MWNFIIVAIIVSVVVTAAAAAAATVVANNKLFIIIYLKKKIGIFDNKKGLSSPLHLNFVFVKSDKVFAYFPI